MTEGVIKRVRHIRHLFTGDRVAQAERGARAEQLGEWFRREVQEKAGALGVAFNDAPQHGEVEHNRMVGAALQMIFEDDPRGGVTQYNALAAQKHLPPIRALSYSPTVLEIGPVVVRVVRTGLTIWRKDHVAALSRARVAGTLRRIV